MKRTLIRLAVSTAILCSGFVSFAQLGGGPGGAGPGMRPEVSAAMMRIFGKNKEFTATANTKMDQGSQKLEMPMNMAMLDGKMRSEIDMSAAKGMQIPPQAMAQMKQMGMDKMVSITRPDLEKSYIIYPGMKAYAEMPLSKAQADAAKKEAKIQTTEEGKETVDGHPTVKNKVTITDDEGKTHEMTVWNATDLKDFPVKMAMTASGANIEVLYKDVKFSKPDAALFEPPSDYEKFTNVQEMVMQKMMGSFQKK